MNHNIQQRPSPGPFPEDEHPLAAALAVSDELAEAFSLHGIVLPSLGPDLASCTATVTPTAPPRQLIELGRVNMTTAQQIIDALRRSARTEPPHAHPAPPRDSD
ncbi:hypothetical protein [Streptomyces sp. WMMB303]|uniref:hypothetical protein n=1 Tax=Streptomyces sp. WMMB303 TaxID=3034154 RepID=UPI0023EAA340|nr:hypothetical protein [Streptomyces sp. WMMB303]MDF4251130.1 hypothetical protein [Streptomyces sp. WMMB303]